MMGSKGSKGLVCDINVTPLVDVMLVLLIIFMVTAPMMTQSDDINLPKTPAQPLRQKDDPLAISVNKEGRIKLKEIEMTQAVLIQQLKDKVPDEEKKNQMIYLSADKDVPYKTIYSLFESLRESGFTQVGMVTKHIEDAADKRQ
ncbi:MAG: ExbD/TolR family protein [Desulfobulbaceae bacterium]|nr:ExbD/TolR family protein [Desulfobulbaceae bacterium]